MCSFQGGFCKLKSSPQTYTHLFFPFFFGTHFRLLERQSHTEGGLVNPASSGNPWSVSFTTRKRAEKRKGLRDFPLFPLLSINFPPPPAFFSSPPCVSHTLISCLSVVQFTWRREPEHSSVTDVLKNLLSALFRVLDTCSKL